MTANPTIPCAACSNAAAIWAAAKAAAERDEPRPWHEGIEARMEAAADRYDPDAERVTSRRPA